MANSNPSTPVKVPSSAASYSNGVLDPDMRSQINTILLSDGHATKIQEALLHSLHASPSNWPTTLRSHALSLLRSGEISTYPELLRRVLSDVRAESDVSVHPVSNTNGTNGDKSKQAKGPSGDKVSLAIPQYVIDEALRVTRESLENVCEVDENGNV
ncbi:uncharacterized protein J7T54_004525 [Emericellopsis cladophorae]|uniref:Uncharacterized protein n=1 Tax=Emericellopsis cladophorae TaxID=2686198 RepID=A0A9Q0BCE8_9HYPO|nr:uncharacterized protein J7T54_004525 [Emericellopsis cladophorae]KAI6779029.1 hypothetical protein J7T54_004525 [Emericellopsis cladophorae]